MKRNFSYDIYIANENNENWCYVAKERNANGKCCKINFDTDKRGGLKIVFLEETDSSSFKTLKVLFENVNDFIKVNAYKSFLAKEDELCVNREIYNIMTNKYLKSKPKYVVWDGVVEKVYGGRIVVEGYYDIEYPTFKIC